MAKKKLINCKACDAEIAASAKTCPHCGAKNKKPIYKRAWFWILIVILLVAATSGGETETTTPIETKPTAIHTQEEVAPPPTPIETTEAHSETEISMTTGQKNALKSAKNYLSFSAFSYDGLIKQLEFEKYTTEEAIFAVENCGADWNEQALKSARNYLSFSAFSYSGLIKQLEFEGFTSEQAAYGADNCNADWNEQAAKSAENYLSFSSFSKDGLIQQLKYEGFTQEQAVYGAEQNGF